MKKILIVARTAWNDSSGTCSTLSNLFSNYDPNCVAHIYVDSQRPCTSRCNRFFQISEASLIKKIFKPWLKAGKCVENKGIEQVRQEDINADQKILAFSRRRRLWILKIIREFIWLLNGWKSKELKSFIKEFNPDVVWLDGSTDIFLNRLYNYVVDVANKPVIFYFMDDNYTWKSLVGHHYIYRYFMRLSVNRLVNKSSEILTISPKMKREFDSIFEVDSTIITKGIDYSDIQFKETVVHDPIRVVYLGQLIYGRLYTVQKLAEKLDFINKDGVRIVLNLYTNTYMSDQARNELTAKGSVVIHEPVPYSQVASVIADNDVLLFVESFDSKYNRDARLSFSTKITDYLCGGKCILAIGPEDSAPIEYFKEEDAALVATSVDQIVDQLNLLQQINIIPDYALKAFECGKRNHSKDIIEKRLFDTIDRACSNSSPKNK